MSLPFLQLLLDWIALHPTWSGAIIFLIALLESLAVVGLFMPGAVLLFGVGTVVAAGSFPLSHGLLWVAAGAITGDGLSFLLGRHYREHLREIWPLRRYPQLLARGEQFFGRHGGKSVLIGRFVGPIRPVIPAIAGMLGMPPARFFLINIGSALVWAPAYILPGVVFGASLGLASQVAGRLVVLLLLLLVAIWLAVWLVFRLYRLLLPHADATIEGLLEWGYAHPRLGRITVAVLDPHHRELRGLLQFAGLLLLSVWLFLTTLGLVLRGPPLGLDTAIFNLLQGLRSPWADEVMVLLGGLGGAPVILAVATSMFGWLLLAGHRISALYWLAAVAFGGLAPVVLKLMLKVPRPLELFSGWLTWGFPSWHVSLCATLYGFLAVLVATELRPARRWLVYAAALVITIVVGLSRLYLGVHWLSDVVGGLALGLAWVSVLGLAYRRHSPKPIGVRGPATVTFAAFLLTGAWYVAGPYRADLVQYAPQPAVKVMTVGDWLGERWRTFPAYRLDLEGDRKQPLELQWVGELSEIEAFLREHGWRQPVPLTPANALLWFAPDAKLANLPVLPQVHAGVHEALVLVRNEGSGTDQRLLVLRLWPTEWRINGAQRLWLGSIDYLEAVRPLPLFSVPTTVDDQGGALAQIEDELRALEQRRVRRPLPGAGKGDKLLLLKGPEGRQR